MIVGIKLPGQLKITKKSSHWENVKKSWLPALAAEEKAPRVETPWMLCRFIIERKTNLIQTRLESERRSVSQHILSISAFRFGIWAWQGLRPKVRAIYMRTVKLTTLHDENMGGNVLSDYQCYVDTIPSPHVSKGLQVQLTCLVFFSNH